MAVGRLCHRALVSSGACFVRDLAHRSRYIFCALHPASTLLRLWIEETRD